MVLDNLQTIKFLFKINKLCLYTYLIKLITIKDGACIIFETGKDMILYFSKGTENPRNIHKFIFLIVFLLYSSIIINFGCFFVYLNTLHCVNVVTLSSRI